MQNSDSLSPGPFSAGTLARWRGQTFQFLGSVFSQEPTGQLLEQLDQPDLVKAWTELEVNYRDVLWQQPIQKRLIELEVEYTRLFIGPGSHIALQESVQRGEGQLWGERTCEVVDWYARLGYELDPVWKDLPDHLSAELYFLSCLADREAEALEKSDPASSQRFAQAQKDFCEQHLAVWVPGWADQVKSQARWAYYPAFAQLVGRLIKESSLSEQDGAR